MSKQAIKIIALVFILALAYSVARYHVFGDVGAKDFPLYIFNKCLALAGFTLLVLTFCLGPARQLGAEVPDEWLSARKEIGIFSFLLILAHILCALLVFGVGGYYGKFFAEEGGINAVGSWSMLLGVLAFVWLWLYNISFKGRQEGDEAFIALVSSKKSVIFAALLSSGHVAIMGFKGWFRPDTWAGGLPPITLVAIVIFLVGFVVYLAGKR